MRDQLVTALKARINTLIGDGHWHVILDDEALSEASQLLSLLPAAQTDLDAVETLGWFRWYRFLALGDLRGEESWPDLRAALAFFEGGGGPDVLQPVFDPEVRVLPAVGSAKAVFALRVWVRAGAALLAEGGRDERLLSLAVHISLLAVSLAPDDPEIRTMVGASLVDRFEAVGDIGDLDQAVNAMRQAAEDTPPEDTRWAGRQTNLAIVLCKRFDHASDPVDLDDAFATVCRIGRVVATEFAGILHRVAPAMVQRFEAGDLTDAEAFIDLCRQCLESTIDQTSRSILLFRLAGAFAYRYIGTGQSDDLDSGIETLREAAALREGPDRARYMNELGLLLGGRYERTAVVADLDEAVGCFRLAYAATPAGDTAQAKRLANLGHALYQRFLHTWRQEDIDEAIDRYRDAAAQQLSLELLVSLGSAFSQRHRFSKNATDLENAITVYRRGLPLVRNDVEEVKLLGNLGVALHRRYNHLGRPDDMSESISLHRRSVVITENHRHMQPGAYSRLGKALQSRFKSSGKREDIDEAITCLQHAQAVAETTTTDPSDDTTYEDILSSLGAALVDRFDQSVDVADLSKALTVARQAVAATPVDRRDHAENLQVLAGAARRCFEWTGEDARLTEAVETARRAVIAANTVDPANRATCLTTLANTLLVRFRRDKASFDLDEAVATLREAIAMVNDDAREQSSTLNALGSALYHRFTQWENADDISEAVSAFRKAISMTPEDDQRLAWRFANLGVAVRKRFDATGDPHDLSEAVELLRAGASNTPEGSSDRASRLFNLGGALISRFDHTPNPEDLTAAISVLRDAVAADPGRATNLIGLGNALHREFDRTGDHAVYQQARDALHTAARDSRAPAWERVTAAKHEGRLIAEVDGPAMAAASLRMAVEMLPLSMPRHLVHTDTEPWLLQMTGLTCDAAACALAADDADGALRLLEIGRAIVFRQALDARADLTELRERAPHLADRYDELCRTIDTDNLTTFTELGAPINEWRRQAAEELDRLIATIRTDCDLPEFPLPSDTTDIAAGVGSVIVVNTSRYRCDALVITSNGLRTVPLPVLSLDDIIAKAPTFLDALDTKDRSKEATKFMREMLAWLWDAVAEPVLTSLGITHTPGQGQSWPRVWWVPTGPLALLPLHAAGHHDGNGRNVLDLVVSSYIPTIRALMHARHPRTTSRDHARTLVVATPHTPGHPDLPGSQREADFVAGRLPSPTTLIDAEATFEAVVKELDACTWAHFSCHGHNDMNNPSRSGLLLHDHEHRRLTVPDIARLRLQAAELAYLSACTTYRTHPALADEAIHLTTAFQLAGYRHVIGTLWPISDTIAADIAQYVYLALTKRTTAPDTAHTAVALHHAIRRVRASYPEEQRLWAAHVHVGP